MPERFTVLTDTVNDGGKYHYIRTAQRFARELESLVYTGKLLKKKAYGGHFAVTRSLIEGLEQLGVEFNYNPTNVKDIHQTVVVLARVTALKQAIELKRRGLIKRLFAGPNIVVVPSDDRQTVTSPEIDGFIANSQWVYDKYILDAPELDGRCYQWPAGVDIDYWSPSNARREMRNLLFYFKSRDKEISFKCQAVAEKLGYKVERIHYGRYCPDDYLESLHRNSCVVYFNEYESQGIGLAEAWATDTPTLVWNPQPQYSAALPVTCSSAPYLTDATGEFFRDVQEFEALLQGGNLVRLNKCRPRQWVTENMSDRVCARKLLDVLKINQ